MGDYASGKAALLGFVESYPMSALAPQSLFQAALHGERLGAGAYPEIVLLYDRLVREYPESDLVYYAGLRQGDLLRLMNDFVGAQLIYENLINSAPESDMRYIAELSRADCIVALASNDGAQLLEAVAILERLVDIPDLPADFQVEVGHKWGRIMQGQEKADEAKLIYSGLAERFLSEVEGDSGLGEAGRYWLARTMLALGGILEDEGHSSEARDPLPKDGCFQSAGKKSCLESCESDSAIGSGR